MTPQELAAKLHGCEYGAEIDRETEREAKAAGLVVVFGASDDLIEFRGAINDELGAGSEVLVDDHGILNDFDTLRDMKASEMEFADYFNRKPYARHIEAHWCGGSEYSWEYTTNIPHATFDVMDDNDKYCRGIVFRLTAPAGGPV